MAVGCLLLLLLLLFVMTTISSLYNCMSSPVFFCIIVEHHFPCQLILNVRNLVSCTKVGSVVHNCHLEVSVGACLLIL